MTFCGSPLALSSIDSEAFFFPLDIGVKVTSIMQLAPASSAAGQFPIVALNSGVPETPSINTGKRILFFFPLGFETPKCFSFDSPTLTEPKFSVPGILRLTGTAVAVAVGVAVAVAVADVAVEVAVGVAVSVTVGVAVSVAV